MGNPFNPPREGFKAHWIGGALQLVPGNIAGHCYFVDSNSGGSNHTGTSWDDAMDTIDHAVNLCTANRGDWIFVHPLHAENLAADSAVDIDVAGVTVWGVRVGNVMPTLTATNVAGDLKLAAANVTVANIRFSGGIDATTGIVEIGAFANCSLLNCEYVDTTGECTDAITILNTASNVLIDGYVHRGAAGAGTNAAIAVDGCAKITIRNFDIYGNFAVGGIDFRGHASTNVNVYNGKIWTENAADIAIVDTITASTGWIGPDLCLMLQDDAANITAAVTGATFQMVDPVYVVNAVNQKAMLSTWTATTNA